MNKLCLYCWRPLDFLNGVQGRLFCSAEHRESYIHSQELLDFAPAPRAAAFVPAGTCIDIRPAAQETAPRRTEAASRIVQSLESRKVAMVAMPAPVPPAILAMAAEADLKGICTAAPVASTNAVAPKRIEPLSPAELDPIVRFAARVGQFGPFRPKRSLRPWAISALAAGLTLAALLSVH